MKTVKITKLGACATCFAVLNAFALNDVTVPAPEGVGDVVALTNALAQVAAGKVRHVLLTPGVYELSDVVMTSGVHLQLKFSDKTTHMLAGTGATPGDTILKGGGQTSGCRVMTMQGDNWRYATLSNLTVTGGYTTGNGGGIVGHASARIIDCVVSNNFAYGVKNGGGGGMYKGSAIRCLFADNEAGRDNTDAVHGGGIWCNGDVTQGGLYQQVVDCVFSNNWCRNNGGGCYGSASVSGCTFFANSSDGNGGGAYCTNLTDCVFVRNTATGNGGGCAPSGATFSCVDSTFEGNVATGNGGGVYAPGGVSGCTFVTNRAENGGAIYAGSASSCGPISNCTFRMNAATVAGCAVMGADMASAPTVLDSVLLQNTNGTVSASAYVTYRDSVITNHYGTMTILQNCNLYGCYVADNRVVDTDKDRYYAIDLLDSSAAGTNANCIFESNYTSSPGSRLKIVSGSKIIVNCTFVKNKSSNSKWGHIIDPAATVYNTVYLENEVGSYANFNSNYGCPTMTNCTYSALPSGFPEPAKWEGVFKAARSELMFASGDPSRPYVPSRKSPLCNAAYSEPWILSAVGATDFYGQARVFEGALDIGAAECNVPALGMFLLFR